MSQQHWEDASQQYASYPQPGSSAGQYASEAPSGQLYNKGPQIPQHVSGYPGSGGGLQGPPACHMGYLEDEDPHSYGQARVVEQLGRRMATEHEARRRGISPGHNLEHWNPDEPPFAVFGFVYDPNSLENAIYDSMVAACGGDEKAPLVNVAGELWRLLKTYAECVKRASELWGMGSVLDPDERDMVYRHIHTGNRQMASLNKLLRKCDEQGREYNLGLAEILLNGSRMLKDTEEFMQRLKDWQGKFDEFCEPILTRHGKGPDSSGL